MISGKNIDRRTVLKAGVAALGSSLSGISWAQGSGDTLTMGVISQQTGTFAYAGGLVLKGAQLALEERDGSILGKKINLVVRDDEGKPAVGVRRLTETISSEKLRTLPDHLQPSATTKALSVTSRLCRRPASVNVPI